MNKKIIATIGGVIITASIVTGVYLGNYEGSHVPTEEGVYVKIGSEMLLFEENDYLVYREYVIDKVNNEENLTINEWQFFSGMLDVEIENVTLHEVNKNNLFYLLVEEVQKNE